MSPSRKRRTPTFDLPPAAEQPAETGWTYRSDAKPAATVKDSRGRLSSMAVAERAIAALARPFEVALVCLLVPFGKRSRKVMCLLFVAGLALQSARCQRADEQNWAGVKTIDRDEVLVVASPEPRCSCLTLTSTIDKPITLRSRMNQIYDGTTVLPPHGSITALFDWAGETNDDVYHIVAHDPDGKPVKFGSAIKYVHSGWTSCTRTSCEFGPLKMSVATLAGH